jgi:hypothetical protein
MATSYSAVFRNSPIVAIDNNADSKNQPLDRHRPVLMTSSGSA